MPVYHVSDFDVSAVQIDLSANIFNADSANLSADYWVDVSVNFNSYTEADNTLLNFRFKSFANDVNVDAAIVRRSATRSTSPGTTELPNIFFKDLGIINKNDNTLFSSTIYSNITTLSESNTLYTSFKGKVHAVLQTNYGVTGLRTRMIASINAATGSDLSADGLIPINSKFGFLIVRNLNLAGTSQDQTIHIGCIFTQDPNGLSA